MLTNILARDFHVKMSDYYSVDISPDVHVKRVMTRIGFLDRNPTPDMVIYKAREIHPEYPGIIDLSFWKIGREYCRTTNPECNKCPLHKECPKFI